MWAAMVCQIYFEAKWFGGNTLILVVGKLVARKFVLTNATLWAFGFDGRT